MGAIDAKPAPGAGMRLTRQRQILLDLIDKTGEHLDAESLYHLARREDPKLVEPSHRLSNSQVVKEGGWWMKLDLMHQAGEQHYYETRGQPGTCPCNLPRVRKSGRIFR